MPFLIAICSGVVLGLLRGGRFDRLALLHFRQPWLLAAGALLWLVTGPLPPQLWLRLAAAAPLLLLLAHALLLLFVWRNRAIPWLILVGLGLLSNLVVMAANGGQMPADEALLGALGLKEETALLQQQGLWLHFGPITPDTRLPFLGDVLYLGPPFPWPRLWSPGDVLIAIGAFLVGQAAMLSPTQQQGQPALDAHHHAD